MQYTYDGYLGVDTGPGGSLQRIFTTTSFVEVEKEYSNVDIIKVTDNISKQEVFKISIEDDLAEWRTTLERKAAWNPVKDLLADHMKKDPGDIPSNEPADYSHIALAVDPSHYKAYIDEYQWIDAMSRLPRYRDPNVFIGALELQVRKYLDRMGQKDNDYQELGKATFYLEYWRQYVGWAFQGKPRPTAESVHAKLSRE